MIKSIQTYLKLRGFENPKVSFFAKGEYNLNYLIDAKEKYVFRINLAQQSGLKNQISYEYKTLKFLQPFDVAPKPIFRDDIKKSFNNDVLMYKYVPGRWLRPRFQDMISLAKTLYVLHSIKIPKKIGFMKRNFIEGDLKLLLHKFGQYKEISEDDDTIDLLANAIKKFSSQKITLKLSYCLVHTDLVPENILINKGKCYFVDWEKARIDDPSYDLCCILGPFSIWSWKKPLSKEMKKVFIENYPGFKRDKHLMEKVKLRQPIVTAWALLWIANRLVEIDKGRIDKRLISDKTRYQRFFDYNKDELRSSLS